MSLLNDLQKKHAQLCANDKCDIPFREWLRQEYAAHLKPKQVQPAFDEIVDAQSEIALLPKNGCDQPVFDASIDDPWHCSTEGKAATR
mgnify:CR=1 FL=1